MAPSKRRGVASRHLVCRLHFDSSGCPKSWAEMREGSPACVFICKGCREVARLVGEVDIRLMMESMKAMVMGQGLKEKGGVRGDRVEDWKKRGRRRSTKKW